MNISFWIRETAQQHLNFGVVLEAHVLVAHNMFLAVLEDVLNKYVVKIVCSANIWMYMHVRNVENN